MVADENWKSALPPSFSLEKALPPSSNIFNRFLKFGVFLLTSSNKRDRIKKTIHFLLIYLFINLWTSFYVTPYVSVFSNFLFQIQRIFWFHFSTVSTLFWIFWIEEKLHSCNDVWMWGDARLYKKVTVCSVRHASGDDGGGNESLVVVVEKEEKQLIHEMYLCWWWWKCLWCFLWCFLWRWWWWGGGRGVKGRTTDTWNIYL